MNDTLHHTARHHALYPKFGILPLTPYLAGVRIKVILLCNPEKYTVLMYVLTYVLNKRNFFLLQICMFFKSQSVTNVICYGLTDKYAELILYKMYTFILNQEEN
jgi:hypothetical protein